MAEASSAVAFQFSVEDDGIHYQFSPKVFYKIMHLFFKGYLKRFVRISNTIHRGTFPSSPFHFLVIETLLLLYAIYFPGTIWPIDSAFYFIDEAYRYLPWYSTLTWLLQILCITLPIAVVSWFLFSLIQHYCLRFLLVYHAWVFEDPKKVSLKTIVWTVCLKILCGYSKELLFSYQRSLPKLPLPPLNSTICKYLESIKPYQTDEEYKKTEELAKGFLRNEGNTLQRYLVLRTWITQNYITDWWEDYVYLASGRKATHPSENTTPYPGIMINSNYYLIDMVLKKGPRKQASRAASLTLLCMEWKAKLESENVCPLKVPNSHVPLCMNQYKRLFGTTRIPMKGQDYLKMTTGRKSGHVVVYHEGRFYKIEPYNNGKLVTTKQMEKTFEDILSDTDLAKDAEKHLPAFTALDRDDWADFRDKYISFGINKISMDIIDTAAFVVVLDRESMDYGDIPEELYTKDTLKYKRTYDKGRSYLSEYCTSVLFGNGSNRWYDKSLTLVIYENGTAGINCEHSFADAPVLGHLCESIIIIETDYLLNATSINKMPYRGYMLRGSVSTPRYNSEGYLNGEYTAPCCKYERLEWNFNEEAARKIEIQNEIAVKAANCVTFKVEYFPHFGREAIKECKCSPDAFLQMAIQLAGYKNIGRFSLTYESAMTRLFREGRTETVRPVTKESCRLVRLMLAESINVVEAYEALQCAMKKHVRKAKEATTGQGIDRHLFALYVVSKGKKIDSPFLNKVIVEPWKLSTSQTPTNQTGIDQALAPECSTGGGGFPPVTKHGYGVSYIFTAGRIALHVSSFKDSPYTDSVKFYNEIVESMVQIRNISLKALAIQKETKDFSSHPSANGRVNRSSSHYMSFNDSILPPSVPSARY